MNDYSTFSTTATINEDNILFSYNDHISSQPLLPFSPCSSINDILIHSNSNTSNNHLDHLHHQFLQASSPFSHFESAPDFALLASFLPQNNGHDGNQTNTTSDHNHPPSLLPLNNPIGESHLFEPTQIKDPQRSSTSQNPKMKKVKKPSRTDRHSKIKTAKGTRDRRMRLSLDIAKELFGLQDMLGFDKASKTVEWLLTQAKPEILNIANSLSTQWKHRQFSSCEEFQTRLGSMDTSPDLCELTSMWTVEDRGSNTNTTETRGNKVDVRSISGKRRRSQPRTPILNKLTKEARAKARERAKDRTKEKMMKRNAPVNVVVEEKAHNHHDEIVPKNNKSNVKATTPCEETIQELLCKNDCFAVCNEFVVDRKDHILDEFDSSFPMIDHHRSQWAASSKEQQQFADLRHFLGKPRDLMYNYHSM